MKRVYIFLLFLAVFSVGLSLFLIFKEPSPPAGPKPSGKTWVITLSFNTENETLSFKNLEILDQAIEPDFRGAANSPYQLSVLDKDGKVLYYNKIHITEELSHSIFIDYPIATASTKPPTEMETALFIPYFEQGVQIQIYKENKVILSINTKKKQTTTIRFIPQAYAQTPPTAGPIKVVILFDGYFTLAEFQQQAQSMINAFQATPPYAGVNPSIFEFIQANSINHFECAFNPFNSNPNARPTGCSEQAIKSAGYATAPQAAKFIVLTDTLHLGSQLPFSGSTNDIGGDIALIGTNQPSGISFTKVAAHEFLGHGVGELYDRYTLFSKPGIKRGIRSNCSDNPSGEVFWRTVGANGPYPQGCDNPNLFAPAPNDCGNRPPPPGYNGPLLTLGSRSSLMSDVISCNGISFDSVEQAWIRTQIIPRYQAAVITPTPSPTPVVATPPVTPPPLAITPSPSPTPVAAIPPVTPPPLANDCNFNFNLTNGDIVRGEVSTSITAVKSNPSYTLSFIVLNSRIGTFVGASTADNSLQVSWNSVNLFQNGPATIRCAISQPGGASIFSKDVTVNVQN